jgi:2-aminoethylphosphonate-pyruvate transaminase
MTPSMTSTDLAATWAVERAIDLWIVVGEPVDLVTAVEDGAAVVVRTASESTPFAVFDAMRETGVHDVRRVGVVTLEPAGVDVGRQSGAGAVVAVADDPGAVDSLLAAEPDALVRRSELDSLYTLRYGSRRPFRPQVLLNPGPALTSAGVKRAAAGVDLCHREPEFTLLERQITDKLRRVADVGDEWIVAMMSGSGTGAVEASLRAAVRPGRRALVVSNGVYGARLRSIAQRAGIATVTCESAWTEPADLEELESILATRADIDAVAVVHHETTTGLLNPVAEIAETARAAKVAVVVDGISSFGAEELALAGSGIDFLVCSSNKCLQGLPGAAFVLISPRGADRVAEVPPSSVYLDLGGYLGGAASGSVPFTPAIPALSSLDAALGELLARGPAEHRLRYAERAAVLDAVLEGLGLEPIVASEHRSRTVRAIPLPRGVDYEDLHAALKRDGYVIYAGQGPLAAEIFRVCCMGTLELDTLRAFGDRLAAALDREPAPA